MKKVLIFHSQWCGQCKLYHQIVDKVKKTIDTPVYYLDIDDEEVQKEVEKYNVLTLPYTVIIDENDKVVDKWVGVLSASDLVNKIK